MEALDTILKGLPVPCETLQVNDTEFIPVIKKSVAYIVCGIVINDNDEILLMQEAKKSCYGLWYLPAGRMEKNETIHEAVKREVQEETGFEFEPESLILVEAQPPEWYRFSLYGRIIGGSLKTPAQGDKESLQGGFFPIDKVMSGKCMLRSHDIINLITKGQQYKKSLVELPPAPPVVPAVVAHKQILLRTVCVRRTGTAYELLSGKNPQNPFPAVSLDPTSKNILKCAVLGFNHIFGHTYVNYTLHGVLSVEHNGKPAHVHDGMCLTVLLSLTPKAADAKLDPHNSSFEWKLVPQGPLYDLLQKKISTSPLNAALKFD